MKKKKLQTAIANEENKKKDPTKGTCEKMVPAGLLVWPKFQSTSVTLVIFFFY